MSLDPGNSAHFFAVVETGSLGRAAEALHLTEPAVSGSSRGWKVNSMYCCCERRTTGMELTTFGHALLPYANLLNTEANQAVEQIRRIARIDRGTLRLERVASAAIMVLPMFWKQFCYARPVCECRSWRLWKTSWRMR